MQTVKIERRFAHVDQPVHCIRLLRDDGGRILAQIAESEKELQPGKFGIRPCLRLAAEGRNRSRNPSPLRLAAEKPQVN